MGIKRLYSYLKIVFEKKELNYLTGKKVGIDAMGWLYQAYFGQCGLEEEVKLSIIRSFEKKIGLLEKNGIEYVFVIDGCQLDCKVYT